MTYPIVTAMLGAPKVKAIRGFSDFGFSYVYVIFEDGTDIYWARSRTLEYLTKITPALPAGVQTELGPDATGVGWVYQYALVDKSGTERPRRAAHLPGLVPALLAPVRPRGRRGRFGRRLPETVPGQRRPQRAPGLQHPPHEGRRGRSGTATTTSGGRLLEFSGTEYMVRGRGYAKSIKDIEDIVVKSDKRGPRSS